MEQIVVAMDPSFFREGIKSVLSQHFCGIRIKSYGSSEEQSIIEQSEVADLLIIDHNLRLDIRKVIRRYQNQKIILWLSDVKGQRLLDLLRMNLNGYFNSEMDTNELIAAMKMVLDGKDFIHSKISTMLLNDYVKKVGKVAERPKGVLTKREWDVLELLTQGFSNAGIANELNLSKKTVHNYVSSVLKKLNVSNRIEASLFALKQKWFVL